MSLFNSQPSSLPTLQSSNHAILPLFPCSSNEMQPARQGYTARRIPCQFSSCGHWFKSASGLKTYLCSVHSHGFNVPDDIDQQLPPDVVWEYHEKLTDMSSPLVLAVIKSCPTGNICDANGTDLPEGTPPLPHAPQGQDDWTPYWN